MGSPHHLQYLLIAPGSYLLSHLVSLVFLTIHLWIHQLCLTFPNLSYVALHGHGPEFNDPRILGGSVRTAEVSTNLERFRANLELNLDTHTHEWHGPDLAWVRVTLACVLLSPKRKGLLTFAH
jgi:hypothetical protein